MFFTFQTFYTACVAALSCRLLVHVNHLRNHPKLNSDVLADSHELSVACLRTRVWTIKFEEWLVASLPWLRFQMARKSLGREPCGFWCLKTKIHICHIPGIDFIYLRALMVMVNVGAEISLTQQCQDSGTIQDILRHFDPFSLLQMNKVSLCFLTLHALSVRCLVTVCMNFPRFSLKIFDCDVRQQVHPEDLVRVSNEHNSPHPTAWWSSQSVCPVLLPCACTR